MSGSATQSLLSKLAPTILATGAKDTLVTADVYSINNSNVLNSPTGKLTGFATSFMESFRQNSSNIFSNLAGLVNVGSANQVSLDPSALTGRASMYLGAPVANLSTNLQSQFASYSGIGASSYNTVVANIGGTLSTITAGGLDNTQGLFSLINRVAGDQQLAQVFDVGAEANIVSGIISESLRLGLPQAIDVIVQNTKTEKAAQIALLSNVRGAITNSDMSTIHLMITKLGVGGILADVPNAASLLVQSYRMPSGSAESNYGTLYADLLNVLDTLQPGWAFYYRDGESVFNLSLFSGASADAKMLFKTTSTYRLPALIGGNFPSVDLATYAKQLYPYALL